MRRILYLTMLTILTCVSLVGAAETATTFEQLLTGATEAEIVDSSSTSAELLGWQAILTGDDEAARRQFLAVIEADPAGLRGSALLRDQLRFAENVVRFDELRELCEKILQNESAAPATRRVARRWLYYFASQQRDDAALAKLNGELGYLQQWQVIAPFIEVGYLDFNRPFEPEERIRESYELPSLGEYTWQTPGEGLYQGFVAFEDYSPIARGVGYALSYIYLPEAGEYQLHLESDDSIRILLDGVEVGLRDSHFGYPAVESTFGFRAEAGWHRLLIKSLRQTTSASAQISVSWGFRLALTDSAGEAIQGLLCKADREMERELSRGEVVPLPQPEPVIDGVSERFYRAMIAAHQEDYDGAIRLLNGLVEEYPESILGRLALAWVLDSDGSPERAARARTNYSRVVAADPLVVPAQLSLAEIEAEEGKFWSSLERLKSMATLAPTSERIQLTLAERYRERGFTSLERTALQNAEELAPENLSVLHQLAIFHRRQRDFDQAEEYLMRAVRLAPDNLILWRDLADLLQNAGQYRQAYSNYQNILELDPYDAGVYLELARCCMKGGFGSRLDEYEAMVNCAPFDYRGYLQWAMALEEDQGGDSAELYAEALRRYPGKDWLRGYLAWRSEAESDPFLPDVDELIANAPAAEDYPENDAVVLLDYMRVDLNADFTYNTTVRKVLKFLAPSGVDRWGEMTIPDDGSVDIVYARTYTPDGELLDATVFNATGSGLAVSLEGAVPGAIVDIYYHQPVENRVIYDLLDYWTTRFYFQEYNDPMVMSRFVVTAPEGMELEDGDLNFHGWERRKQLNDGFTTKDGASYPTEPRDVWIYTEEETEAIISEGMMPARGEFAPLVAMSSMGDAETYFDWYYGRALAALIPDEQLSSLAEKLIAGKSTQLAEASSIYRYVVTRLKHMGGSIFYPNSVRSVYHRRSGTTVEKLLIFKTLAELSGIPVELCLTRSRWDGPIVGRVNSPLDYTEVVGRMVIDDEVYWIDFLPGHVPLGTLITEFQEQPVWRCEARRFETLPAPPINDHRLSINMELELNALGAGRGSLTEFHHGLASADRISYFDSRDATDYLDAELNGFFPGAILEEHELFNTHNPNQPFGYSFTFTGERIAQPVSDGLLVSGVPFPLELSPSFITRQEREYPMAVTDYHAREEVFRYLLPEGYRVAGESLLSIELEEGDNYYRLLIEEQSDSDGRWLAVARTVYLPPQLIETREYEEFREFCRTVDEIERQQVKLDTDLQLTAFD